MKLAESKLLPEAGDGKALAQSFKILLHNPELIFQFIDLFPIPIEVFDADGTMVFLNQAMLKLNNIPDEHRNLDSYNVLCDPVMAQMGLSDGIQRAYRGEYVVINDVNPPIQDLVDRRLIAKKPFEKASMDFHLYPIMDGNKVAFVISVFVVKALYHERPDLARAMEYIDSHKQEKFDPEKIAKFVNMSVKQLYYLFHKHLSVTPGDYYRNKKVECLKEKLKDTNLSIKEAFAACGVDSRGAYAKIFKNLTGLSPSQYRKALKQH